MNYITVVLSDDALNSFEVDDNTYDVLVCAEAVGNNACLLTLVRLGLLKKLAFPAHFYMISSQWLGRYSFVKDTIQITVEDDYDDVPF
jgi:hypothetical protein